MYNLVILALLIVLFTPSYANEEIFVGQIIYKNSFTDLKGNNISERLAPFYGAEVHYSINERNYKATDENKRLMYLYNGDSNRYYYFNKDKSAKKFDAGVAGAGKNNVTKLSQQETIAGIVCNSLRVEDDTSTTIYFYSPTIKTVTANFSRHSLGDWNQYLTATDGALPLKFIVTDRKNGYVWTSTATNVTKKKLTAQDFELPAGIKILE